MRSLIIDDSKTTRTILGRLLQKIGFEVIEAQDGLVGVKQLEVAGPFDLAIVDLNMPEMNGSEFIQETRKNSSNNDLKILVLTIDSSLATISKAFALGADEYAVKPISETLLREKLAGIGVLPGDSETAD